MRFEKGDTVFTYFSESNIVTVEHIKDLGYNVIQKEGEVDTNPIIVTCYSIDSAMNFARTLISDETVEYGTV